MKNKPFLVAIFLLSAWALASFMPGAFIAFAADSGVYLEVTKQSTGTTPSPVAISVFSTPISKTLNDSGVDVQSRGAGGVQSDISIRGSNFEQPQVLLDGIKMNDPQTGHHNIDLPVMFPGISSISVDRSKGGGVIEINTGGITGEKPNYLSLGMLYGSYDTYGLNLDGCFNAGNAGRFFNISRTKSGGYFAKGPGKVINDYDISNFFMKIFTGSDRKFSPRTVYAGYTAKDFGAYDFYTPFKNYSSRENTKTEFLRADFAPYRNFSSSIYVRRHTDVFTLIETAPAIYKNSHVSGVYGFASKLSSGRMDTGFDAVYENIDSTGTKGGLGSHGRSILSVYGLYGFMFFGIDMKPGARAEYNTFFNDSEILPEFTARKKAGDITELHFMANRAYRLPSFTELYYEDLVNKGDSNLKKESSWNYTLGADFNISKLLPKVSCDFFLRDEANLIDWVETPAGSSKYSAINVGSVRRQGAELRAAVKLRAISFSAGYNHTENLTGGYSLSAKSSKYALRNPINQVFSTLSFDCAGITCGVSGVYKDRENESPYTVVSSGLSKKIFGFDAALGVTNLMDAAYEELPGVPQPGRLIQLGVTYQIK